jgi:hypothetical protein
VAYGFLFVVGFVLSRRMTGRVLAQQLAVASCSLGIVALNPVGLGVLEAPFAVHSTSKYIVEWHRTDLASGAAVSALLMAAVIATVWIRTSSGTSWPRALVLVSAVFWTWYAARTVALAGLVLAPLLAEALDRLVEADKGPTSGRMRRSAGRKELILLSLAALVASAAIAFVASTKANQPGNVPVVLDPALDRLPAGTRVFNAYELGGWIAWRHPKLEQYIDGLITPYTASHADRYYQALTLKPGWYRIVRASRASIALLETSSPLAKGLEGKGWRMVETGDGYSILGAPAGSE